MIGFDSVNALQLHCSPKHTSPLVRFDNDLIRKAMMVGLHADSSRFN